MSTVPEHPAGENAGNAQDRAPRLLDYVSEDDLSRFARSLLRVLTVVAEGERARSQDDGGER